MIATMQPAKFTGKCARCPESIIKGQPMLHINTGKLRRNYCGRCGEVVAAEWPEVRNALQRPGPTHAAKTAPEG